MVDVSPFQAIQAAKLIARYMGYVECQIADLKKTKLNAGLRALEAARLSENNRDSLLQTALAKLYEGIENEVGYRKACAHLGAAMCHQLRNDMPPAKHELAQLLLVPEKTSKAMGFFKRATGLDTEAAEIALSFGLGGRAADSAYQNFQLRKLKVLVEKYQHDPVELLKALPPPNEPK